MNFKVSAEGSSYLFLKSYIFVYDLVQKIWLCAAAVMCYVHKSRCHGQESCLPWFDFIIIILFHVRIMSQNIGIRRNITIGKFKMWCFPYIW